MNRDRYSNRMLTPEEARFAGRVLLALVLFLIVWVAVGIKLFVMEDAPEPKAEIVGSFKGNFSTRESKALQPAKSKDYVGTKPIARSRTDI